MKRLWAPWRVEYFKIERYQGCFLCDYPKKNRDDETYIVWRGKKCFVILNRFPYNSGHVMVSPYRHVSEYEDLTDEEILEMAYATKIVVRAIKEEFNAHGFNIGFNLGKAAGASIYEHIHLHIVPRWEGDTNFMPVIGNTKIISEGLKETYERLKKAIKKIESEINQ